MFEIFPKKKKIIIIAVLPIFLEGPWVLELIRILVEYVLTCKMRFEYGWVWTWKCLNPERKSYEFKKYPDTFGRGQGPKASLNRVDNNDVFALEISTQEKHVNLGMKLVCEQTEEDKAF